MSDYIDYPYDGEDKIKDLLVGRKIVSVDQALGEAVLDNGTVLELSGNDGGCSCGAGDYWLTELNNVDNVITAVEIENDGDVEGTEENGYADEAYRIFVYAENEKLKLAEFSGSDGNGYYGTGFSISVKVAG